MKKHHLNRNGFTLIEMAIVLVIVGLLIGMGVGMIGPLTNRAKMNETRDSLSANVEAITSWAASNNRLPAGYTELDSLSILSKKTDAWGNWFYYFYDPLLSPTPGNICGRKTTNLTICKTLACAPSDRISNIAYAIISAGENYNPQTGIIPCPTGVSGICLGVYETGENNGGNGIDNCTDTTNCPTLNIPVLTPPFIRIQRPVSEIEPYDDIVKWVTLDELRSKTGCQGAQLKIVNNELPYGSVLNAYSVTIIADGGFPFSIIPPTYKWCVSSLPTGFTQTGGVVNTNCIVLGESSWAAASANLTISFPASATTTGGYQLTVVVRDNNDATGPNDNITSKSYVLTVNP